MDRELKPKHGIRRHSSGGLGQGRNGDVPAIADVESEKVPHADSMLSESKTCIKARVSSTAMYDGGG